MKRASSSRGKNVGTAAQVRAYLATQPPKLVKARVSELRSPFALIFHSLPLSQENI